LYARNLVGKLAVGVLIDLHCRRLFTDVSTPAALMADVADISSSLSTENQHRKQKWKQSSPKRPASANSTGSGINRLATIDCTDGSDEPIAKRSKTAIEPLAPVVPPVYMAHGKPVPVRSPVPSAPATPTTPGGSVATVARPKLKSTTELLAEYNATLPDNMQINVHSQSKEVCDIVDADSQTPQMLSATRQRRTSQKPQRYRTDADDDASNAVFVMVPASASLSSSRSVSRLSASTGGNTSRTPSRPSSRPSSRPPSRALPPVVMQV
jgi:hypothetical protein